MKIKTALVFLLGFILLTYTGKVFGADAEEALKNARELRRDGKISQAIHELEVYIPFERGNFACNVELAELLAENHRVLNVADRYLEYLGWNRKHFNDAKKKAEVMPFTGPEREAFRKAEQLIRERKFELVAEELKKHAKSPYQEWRYLKGRLKAYQGDALGSIRETFEALRANPFCREAYVTIGDFYFSAGAPGRAASWYAVTLQQDETDCAALEGFGAAQISLGELGFGVMMLEKARVEAEKYGDASSISAKLAMACTFYNEPQRAAELLKQLKDAKKDTRRIEAAVFLAQGQFPQAQKLLEEVVAAGSPTPNDYFDLWNASVAQGENLNGAALVAHEKKCHEFLMEGLKRYHVSFSFLRSLPGYGDSIQRARLQLKVLSVQQFQLAKAKDLFAAGKISEGLKILEGLKSPEGSLLAGTMHLRRGELDEADKQLTAAYNGAKPPAPEMVYYLALCRSLQGKTEEAGKLAKELPAASQWAKFAEAFASKALPALKPVYIPKMPTIVADRSRHELLNELYSLLAANGVNTTPTELKRKLADPAGSYYRYTKIPELINAQPGLKAVVFYGGAEEIRTCLQASAPVFFLGMKASAGDCFPQLRLIVGEDAGRKIFLLSRIAWEEDPFLPYEEVQRTVCLAVFAGDKTPNFSKAQLQDGQEMLTAAENLYSADHEVLSAGLDKLDSVMTGHAKDLPALFLKGEILTRLERSSALEMFEKGAEGTGLWSTACKINLARVKHTLSARSASSAERNLNQICELFEEALSERPDLDQVSLELSRLYANVLRNDEKAMGVLKNAIARKTNFETTFLMELAAIMENGALKKRSECEQYYRQAIERKPGDPALLAQLVEFYQKTLIKTFRPLGHPGQNLTAEDERGRLYANGQTVNLWCVNYNECAPMFDGKKVEPLGSLFGKTSAQIVADLNAKVAELRQKADQIDARLIGYLQRMIEIDPTSERAHFAAGKVCYYMQGVRQGEEAKVFLRQSIRHLEASVLLEPYDESAWNLLGITQRLDGNLDGAVAAFKAQYEITHDFFDGLVDYLAVLKTKGEFAKIKSLLAEYLKNNPHPNPRIVRDIEKTAGKLPPPFQKEILDMLEEIR